MSWSYSGNPSDSDKDRVRFLIGDTNEDDQLLTDEEIESSLTKNGSDVLQAAVESCYAIAANFSREADIQTGDYSEDLSQRAEAYKDLADTLEQRSEETGAKPFAGGTSKDDIDSREQDSDRPEPSFKKGIHDFD